MSTVPDPIAADIARARADVDARLSLRRLADRLAELDPGNGQGELAVRRADQECFLDLSLTLLSVLRDSLMSLAPEDPLVRDAELVLRAGYDAR